METPDLKSNPINCCHCGAVNNGATLVNNAEDYLPQEGDIGICIKCSNTFVVNSSYVGRCRALSPDEFNELDGDIKKQLVFSKQFCQEYVRKDSEER